MFCAGVLKAFAYAMVGRKCIPVKALEDKRKTCSFWKVYQILNFLLSPIPIPDLQEEAVAS